MTDEKSEGQQDNMIDLFWRSYIELNIILSQFLALSVRVWSSNTDFTLAPTPANLKLSIGRARLSHVCWLPASSPILAYGDRGWQEGWVWGGNTDKSCGESAKSWLGFSPYLCYWLTYYKTSTLWIWTYLFYRKCARGWDELWHLPKVTLRVTWETSNSEMTQDIMCVLGCGEAAGVSSSPNPEPEQSFCKASGWFLKAPLLIRSLPCPQAFSITCVPFIYPPRPDSGWIFAVQMLEWENKYMDRNLHKCWTPLLCQGTG